jgi:nucleoside diphosphate kinase
MVRRRWSECGADSVLRARRAPGVVIVGPQHGPQLPPELSGSSDKLDLYAADTFFIESWEDLVEVTGDEAARVAGVMAGLTLKPDAIVGRVGHPALLWLEAEGFSVIAAERVAFDRRMTREVWRYAWNVATRDRKDVMDLLMCSAPSLFIALRGSAPAALRLSRRKGAADPATRSPGDLREVLGAPAPLINFVHTTDEAADVIREIGVYFTARTRRAIYRAALASPVDLNQVEALIAELEDAVPHDDLTLEPAVKRLLDQLDHLRAHDVDRSSELREQLDRALDGTPVDWRTIARLLDELRVPSSRWDRIVIAAHVVRLETRVAERLLPGIA